jgi:3-hydroxybutyryl-CoA dehydrogenase
MGHGIAQILVRHGYQVTLHDVSKDLLAKAAERISSGLGRDVEKGRLTAQYKDHALARLKTTALSADLAQSDFLIEAATEDFDVKAGIFRAIEPLVREARPEAIFASNTSSISITKLAATTNRPGLFIGLHFFNPVPVMKLVEIIPGLQTSPETLATAEWLAKSVDKTPLKVKDFPGFISNRVLMPMINEAIFAVMEGVAEPGAVDGVMKLGMNHPMGPLELADFIGLDVCLDIMKVLNDGFHDSKYRPCPLLEKMVSAGWLGRKSGRGFYTYTKPAA